MHKTPVANTGKPQVHKRAQAVGNRRQLVAVQCNGTGTKATTTDKPHGTTIQYNTILDIGPTQQTPHTQQHSREERQIAKARRNGANQVVGAQ